MYSNVTRDAEYISRLLGFVMREYQLEPLSIIQAKRGYYGETWRLNTASGSYFLKLDYSAVHQAVYERSFPIMEHLRISGIDFISRIVKTANGALSTKFDGAVLGVFNWIDGDNIEDEQTKAAEYKMLIKIYTVPYRELNIPQEHFNTKSVDLFFNQMKILENSNQTQPNNKSSTFLCRTTKN